MICPETLNLINTMANVVIAISAIVAVITYFNNKNKDNVLAVADQVSFFRERVLSEGNKFMMLVRETDKEYEFSRIRLDEPVIKVINDKYQKEVFAQLDLIKKHKDVFLILQVNCLNLAEELALRVIYSKTYDHKALNSIKPAFIQLIEMTALVLMQEREVVTGNQIYSATLELYSKWKDSVDRSSPGERVKKIIESY